MKRVILLFQLMGTVFVCSSLADPGHIRRFQIGDEPWYLAVGDFNEDSHQDIVTANSSDGTIMVLLGNGSASFPDTASYYSGISPRVLAIGDFNEDSHQDIVVLNSGITSLDNQNFNFDNDNITFFYGYGDGSFSSPFFKTVGDYPAGVVIGDFNEDGHQDLAITNYRSNNVIILTGSGNGTFNTEQDILTFGGPRAVAIGDFNEDAHQDLAVALRTINAMILLEGDGSGTFAVIDTSYEFFEFPRALTIADFNDDGHEDIAAACRGNSRVGMYLGLGTGVFSGPRYYDCGGYPRSLAAVDLDEDGRSDIATGNFDTNDLTFLMGDGEGTMIRWLDQPIGSSPRMLVEGDFDEDGHVDLAVVNAVSDELALLLGSAEFLDPVMISPEDSTWVSVDPTFVWDAVPGAKYFQILVSDTLYDFSWSRIVHEQTSVTYDGSAPLLGGRVYRWQVKQNTGGSFWSYTEPWLFLRRAIQSSLEAPLLKVPDGSDVMLPELFSWHSVDSAYRYALTIHSDTTFTDTVWSGFTESELITVPDLSGSMMLDSVYYWAVTTYDSSGNPGPPSDLKQFTLKASVSPPEAPVLLEPGQSDTVTESPLNLSWSWPEGATRFTLTYSVEGAFPSDPYSTWALEDLTDSVAEVSLPAANENIFWYVTASNGAGESSPSMTGDFFYFVTDSTPLSGVEIIQPQEGREYPFGVDINALALITGSYSGIVEGFWRFDGDSIGPFRSELVDTAGLELHSPPIPSVQEGSHTLQVVVVSPDSIASNSTTFSVSPESVGPAYAVRVTINPQSIQTNGNELATVDAFIVDEDSEVVYSDSGRLVAFVALGEVAFTDGSYSFTEGGKAIVNLTSTVIPDSDIIVFATSESLQTGYATMATFNGDVLNDLTPLRAHMDKLSALTLDVYEPPFDVTVQSYDQSTVNSFLQERITGVEEPLESDKSAMRRLLYMERALYHGYHHEFDMFFPDPRLEPGEGALRMSDGLVTLAWESSLLSLEAWKASSHLITLSRGDSAIKTLVRAKVMKEGLSVLEDLYVSVVSQLGLHPAGHDFLRTLLQTVRTSVSVLDTVDDPRNGMERPDITSDLTRRIVEKIIKDSQANLDTATAWAYNHNFGSSDSLCEQLTEELNNIVDALTHTADEDLDYHFTFSNPELALENLSNLRQYYDKDMISRNDYVVLKSSLESTFTPERWQNFRKMADISIPSLIDAGYGHIAVALLSAFGTDDSSSVRTPASMQQTITQRRGELVAPHSEAVRVNAALWQMLLDRMESRTLSYEEKARELIETISAQDTLLLPDLFSHFVVFDDTVSLDLDMSHSPAGAVYPYGITVIPGFGNNYDTLRDQHTETRFYRIMFILQIYEYLLRPERYTSGLMAIDWGNKAIDSIRDYRESCLDFITSLFTSRAYPLVFIKDIALPEYIRTDGIDTLKVALSNVGAGTAQNVHIKIFSTSGMSVVGSDSAYLGTLASGASSEAHFRIKAVRRYLPQMVQVGAVVVEPFCSNGLGYPALASTDLRDSGDIAWNPGPLDSTTSDSLVSVGLLQPVGGELLAGNSEYEIQWQTYGTGVYHIILFYSKDEGSSYPDTISDWTENDGSYTWTVPQINTLGARVKVVALSAGEVELGSAESPDNFTIDSTPPTVDIIYPDGGDTLYVGLEYNLKWVTNDSFPPAMGVLSLTGTAPVSKKGVVDIQTSASSGKDINPVKVSIRGRREPARHGKVTDESNIAAGPPGANSSPGGWVDGDRDGAREKPLRLLPGRAPGTVNLFYSTDSGETWRVIAVDEPDDSLYIWTVPNRTSSHCRFAVNATDEAGNHGYDMSDSDFVITTLLAAVTGNRDDTAMLRKDLQKKGGLEPALSAGGDEIQVNLPLEFELSQNVPNPFNPSTIIQFAIPGAQPVQTELVIFNLRGRRIVTPAHGLFSPGWHEVAWNGKDSKGVSVGSGVYIYMLRAGDKVFRRKMTLMR